MSDLFGYLHATPPPTSMVDLSDFACDWYGRDISGVVDRMTRVDPEERYASVDDVRAELRDVPSLPEAPADLHLRHPLLIVESGTNTGARTMLSLEDGERRILGRADIAGNDLSISHKHVAFSREGDRYLVEDPESTNGTLLRGLALGKGAPAVEIGHADRLRVGDIFLRFAFVRAL